MRYEKPLDTAEQIFRSGKPVYLKAYYKNYLKDSDNEWQHKLASKAEIVPNGDQAKVLKGIAKTGNGVTEAWFIDYVYVVATSSPQENRDISNVHFSKDPLKSSVGAAAWTVQKLSSWKQAIDRHILLLDQVN